MKNRILALLLVFALVFSLASCGSSQRAQDNRDDKKITRRDDDTDDTDNTDNTDNTDGRVVPVVPVVPAEQMTSTEVAEYAKSRTVTVNASDGTGSGFFIDNNGTLVTNYHVIEGTKSLSVDVLGGGRYDVTAIIDFDQVHDVAILKIDYASDYFERCSEVAQGETVYTVGSSLGDLTGSFNQGILSSLDRMVGKTACYQMDAAISPGNSGGPLVNARGQVIGINSYSRVYGESNNFAIKISQLDTLAMDKNYSVNDYIEWYKKETDRSYSPYTVSDDGTPQTFYYSTTNNYQNVVAGANCIASVYYGNGEEQVSEGYRDCSLYYVYDYTSSGVDSYIAYLKNMGYEYYSESSDNDYWYVNQFAGMIIRIEINTSKNWISITPYSMN